MIIEVTCAVIRNEEGEILVVQRGPASDHPYKWEFPGGKTHGGESHEECIIREIEEELSLEIVICGSLSPVEYDYGHKRVRLVPFVCDTLLDLPVLHEHVAFCWVGTHELKTIDFSEADIPVADEYIRKFGFGLHHNEHNEPEEIVDEKGMREILVANISVEACNLLAESAVENGAVMRTLVGFSMSENSTLAFRSSWCLTKAAELDPQSIEPYYTELVHSLPSLKNESVIRSILKIVSESEISTFDDKCQGIIASCCFEWLNSANSAVAIKVYSMESLYRLTRIYPELGEELRSSLLRVMEDGSAGVKARGKYIIERLRKDYLNQDKYI